ncbi:MAG: NAD(P)-binding domain-containing protein [Pseudomonadales bacterium]|nr:NAD(P)-binding domain-containing protein [Pseudomonadales bacterium]
MTDTSVARMPVNDNLPRVCIIGAGSSGIAACKVFREQGIPFDCYEVSDRIGGMWSFKNPNGMSSAYRSLHINTSRRRMEYSDYPMPDDYPDFPSHFQIADYFNDYVDHFGLRDHIIFKTGVNYCQRLSDGVWQVELSNGETKFYDALMVANGHHWDPKLPDPKFPGTFNGEEIHSHHYIDPTDPIDMKNKNVVIVGFGNSAMDIACELGQKTQANKVYLSTRSGGYIFPKYLGSKPLDELWRHPSEEPSWFERTMRESGAMPYFEKLVLPIIQRVVKSRVGEPQDYGLPKPKHAFGHTHPTISNEIHIRMGSGDVIPKPNITELKGDKVAFADGSEVDADVIIYATGYKISFPFFDDDLISAKDNDIALYQRIMDPRYDNLFFLALVQPICAMMPIAEEQSKWVAAYLRGENYLPSLDEMDNERFATHESMKANFTVSTRHTIEIDCQQYTYDLWKNLEQGRERARLAANKLPVAVRAGEHSTEETECSTSES